MKPFYLDINLELGKICKKNPFDLNYFLFHIKYGRKIKSSSCSFVNSSSSDKFALSYYISSSTTTCKTYFTNLTCLSSEPREDVMNDSQIYSTSHIYLIYSSKSGMFETERTATFEQKGLQSLRSQ